MAWYSWRLYMKVYSISLTQSFLIALTLLWSAFLGLDTGRGRFCVGFNAVGSRIFFGFGFGSCYRLCRIGGLSVKNTQQEWTESTGDDKEHPSRKLGYVEIQIFLGYRELVEQMFSASARGPRASPRGNAFPNIVQKEFTNHFCSSSNLLWHEESKGFTPVLRYN